jgi:hypothetical protein
MFADVQTKQQEHKMAMAEMQGNLESESRLIMLKARTDVQVEQQTSEINTEQQAAGVEAEMNKDIVTHSLTMQESVAQSRAKIAELVVAADLKPIPTTTPKDD